MPKTDTKRCKGCKRNLPLDAYDIKVSNDGRSRRKETCRACISRRIDQIRRYSPAQWRFRDEASAALAGAIRSWFNTEKTHG